MAKVSFVLIPAGQETKFFSALSSGDRFTFSRVRRQVLFTSRKRIKGLTTQSLLPQIAEAWSLLSPTVQGNWNTAAAEMGTNGYRLFTQDKAIRLKNEITGNATPTTLHQSWVGKIQIDSPADECTLAQFHPSQYWVSKKVTGKDQRELVSISEFLALPLTIGISWKTNLSIVSGSSYTARFYAKVYSLYQGKTIENILEIPFGLADGWQRSEVTLNSVYGSIKGYTLFIELDNVRGSLLFDNVKSYHNGQNWARDPFCNSIATTFTRVFIQVPKHWAAEVLPETAYYASIYPDD